MIDFKKVGEAAITAYHNRCRPTGSPELTMSELAERAGRAAVAAMIPPAQWEEHAGDNGDWACSDSCPFLTQSDFGYFCFFRWMQEDGDTWPAIPGPQCPAHKEDKR